MFVRAPVRGNTGMSLVLLGGWVRGCFVLAANVCDYGSNGGDVLGTESRGVVAMVVAGGSSPRVR